MKSFVYAVGAALALVGAPAAAQDRAGDFQFKVLGTYVLPDGGIEEVNVDLVGIKDIGTETEANDNVVPTIAIEYFLTDNFSIETIAGATQHDVDAVAGLPVGSELVSDAVIIPATLTAKLHMDVGGIKPYIGAGPTYWLIFSEEPGAATIPLGVTDFEFDNECGFALQAGVDVPIGDDGFGFSLDAKRYFIDLDASWFAGDTLVIQNKHELDPWVLSAGVAYRF